jgi:hypothetical protein
LSEQWLTQRNYRIIKFGGNTGKVNSFTGVDTGDFTNGVFNGQSLLEGNNLACLFLQATQAGLVDAASPLTNALGETLDLLRNTLGPQAEALSCPELKSLNNKAFSQFRTGSS